MVTIVDDLPRPFPAGNGMVNKTLSAAGPWRHEVSDRKWNDLSAGQRNAIKILALGELTLKIAMLVDIQRRPASQIRGPKGAWRAAAVVNLLGPVSYFAFGRRRAR
jgi:hypothetical protein